MSENLFHKGKKTRLFVQKQEGSEPKKLVKKSEEQDFSHPSNIAIQNEYILLNGLHINGIRKVLGLTKTTKGYELELEYVEGIQVNKAFEDGNLGIEEFLKVAIQISSILDEVHKAGIIHKDISPDNIIYNRKNGKIFLIDFGISTKLDLKIEQLGNPEKLEGNLHYISPEQTGRMDRIIDTRSDLYSLGATLYELLSGAPPFVGETPLELVHAHIAKKPASLLNKPLHLGSESTAIPLILDKIVLKLLEKNAENRYKSAAGLKFDLERCLENWQKINKLEDFTLGETDFSGKFLIPEKLYGMEEQTSFLQKQFEIVEGGETRVVMVNGSSGVGKSALVRDLLKKLPAKKGLFISGKFDQLQKSTPHYAFVAALGELTEILLSENDEQLDYWKNKILEALGNLGKVVTDIVPGLLKIIGEQPEVPELPSIEAQNRREYLLREFMQCFSGKGRPLLLFIDDLQWADEASLELIRNLIIHKESEGLFFIGAYRDNEVDESHPLSMTLKEITKDRSVDYINLGNMQVSSVNTMVAETLGSNEEDTLPLAKLIHEKTGGNAFFVNQFFRSIYDGNGLSFDTGSNSWQWDLENIREMNITENVIELLSSRIKKLDPEVQEALEKASCIGNRFDLESLRVILDKSAVSCFELLEKATRERLIRPVGSRSWNIASITDSVNNVVEFAFQHDRIQQAVYSLIPEKDRGKVHLKIGRQLLANTPEDQLESQVFEIANQVNLGITLIDDPEEKLKIARLNEWAGRKARNSSAYGQSLKYLEAGLLLLPEDAWNSHYDLSLALHLEGLESAYLSGDHDRMEELMIPVLKNGRSILDKINVYHTKVDAYTAQHNLPKAIEAGLEALAQLGVKFPSNPKLIHIFQGLGVTKMKLAGKKIENLVNLPEMTDPYMLEAMPLMERISPAAYMSGSHLFPLLVFKMVNVSLKYGNSALSAFGYASFAITLSGVLGDYDGGYRFAKMSMALLDRFRDEIYKVKVYFVNYCFIRHWKEHSRDMVTPLMDAYRSGMQAGNLFSATWVACYALLWKYFSGQPLGELKKELESFTQTFRLLKQDGAFNLADILLLTVNRLVDPELVSTQLGEVNINDEDLLQRCNDAHDKTAIFFLYLNKIQLNYLYGNYAEGRKNVVKAADFLEAVIGLHYIPLYHFYESLLILADPERTGKDLSKVRSNQKKMKKWAKHAPMNYAHKLALVDAEIAVVRGSHDKARVLFDDAILGAHKNGYVQEEAIAYERAQMFYQNIGIEHLSRSMRQQMIRLYKDWGATAKLKQLDVRTAATLAGTRTISRETHTTLGMESGSSGMLDMESIYKASRILSAEIDLDKIADRFMNIIVENSGSDRGVLLLEENDSWNIRALADLNNEIVELTEMKFRSDNPEDEHLVSPGVVNFVIHSGESLLINDLNDDHGFSKDPYLKVVAPKALICIPLINKNELIGIVYLENRSVARVYNEDRLEMLNILASQVAVSISNAKLYANTKALNEAYEHFVPKEFLNLLDKKSILEVELGNQVQKDMTVLFADIRDFTKLSEMMTPQENFNFINEYLSIMEPIIGKEGGFIDKYIGDAIMALFPKSPDDALSAAVSMIRALNKFNDARSKEGKQKIDIGIGIHMGRLMLGTIGGKMRMDSTVISDNVNIASRVEGLNKEYGTNILVTMATLDKLSSPGAFRTRKISEETVRGKTQSITIFELYNADSPESIEKKSKDQEAFTKGIDAFQDGNYPLAKNILEPIMNSNPEDRVAARLVERCASLSSNDIHPQTSS